MRHLGDGAIADGQAGPVDAGHGWIDEDVAVCDCAIDDDCVSVKAADRVRLTLENLVVVCDWNAKHGIISDVRPCRGWIEPV